MSDALARPPDGFTGFSLRHRYRRMEFDAPGYEGLWVEMRTNLTHAERETFLLERERIDQAARDDYRAKTERAKQIDEAVASAKTDKARATATAQREAFLREQIQVGTAFRRAKFGLVAPYVRAWNVCDDDFADVPAPAVDPDRAFTWIDDAITSWLVVSCEEAYRGGPKERSSSRPSADAPAPPPAPTTGDGEES